MRFKIKYKKLYKLYLLKKTTKQLNKHITSIEIIIIINESIKLF